VGRIISQGKFKVSPEVDSNPVGFQVVSIPRLAWGEIVQGYFFFRSVLEVLVASEFGNTQVFHPPSSMQLGSHNL